MKNIMLMIGMIIIVVVFTSCEKEELLPTPAPSYEFKQTAYLEQNGWSNNEGTYPVFTYKVAIMADAQIDSIKLILTVTLYDSTKVIITENTLTNFGELGYYAPNYEYPVYWIAWLQDSKGVCIEQYGFTEADVYYFEYDAEVKVDGVWSILPTESRKKTDPFDSIWI